MHASAFSLAQQVGGGGRAVGRVEVQVLFQCLNFNMSISLQRKL